jgi:hypothetical protein
MKINRFILATLLVVFGAVFLGGTSANAYTYPNVGNTIQLNGGGPGGQYNGGGEYYWDILNKGTSPMDFISFCIEDNEWISYGGQYKVGGITNAAINGGVGGQAVINGVKQNYDPLDPRTAYLYTEFTNKTLTGFDYNGINGKDYANESISAKALQLAIWYIEDELPLGSDLWKQFNLNQQAKDFVTLAGNAGWSDLGNVRVLNLVNFDGSVAQDQLTMAPVPEPATMLLFGAGLAGLAGLRRRKK